MPDPSISKLPELIIIGGVPKSQFSVFSAAIFNSNLITGNILPRIHEKLCILDDLGKPSRKTNQLIFEPCPKGGGVKPKTKLFKAHFFLLGFKRKTNPGFGWGFVMKAKAVSFF